MQHYTLAFIFTPDYQQVLLIRKNRPAQQAGKLNGLGGKLEPGERPLDCVVREVEEESGLRIEAEMWQPLGAMFTNDWRVELFGAVWSGDPVQAQTLTDEVVGWFPVAPLPETVLSNLSWLIPLAIDKLRSNDFAIATVEYTSRTQS